MAHAVYVTHYMDTRIPGRPDATLIILHAHTIKVMQFTHTNELNNIACIWYTRTQTFKVMQFTHPNLVPRMYTFTQHAHCTLWACNFHTSSNRSLTRICFQHATQNQEHAIARYTRSCNKIINTNGYLVWASHEARWPLHAHALSLDYTNIHTHANIPYNTIYFPFSCRHFMI